ncbi:aldo/keto reductase [Teredinibacter haidensis]|uniref:aldo/keto reductase n=1 Tax=Teredinibacter haidensis TaxID=2731755 RepID=UPI000948D94D|nr:aldo/keto reductase [Teredinibacter haidensis]
MYTFHQMPALGYGTWNRTAEETYNGVITALEVGYRHIDTAQNYENEVDVGKALTDSGLKRQDIFLTTKVKPENYGSGVILPSVRESLEKLQTEQVDLLLLHYPSINNEYPMEDYVAQLAEVYALGLCRHIGVSNFTIPLIDQAIGLLGDGILVNNQVELHPFMQNRPIAGHCKSLGVSITAYSPIARGGVVGEPVLNTIAQRHEATESQVSLAFLMAEGYTVIPAARSRERIEENFLSSNLSLSIEEIEKIRTLDAGKRLVDGPWCPKWDV